jgi:hypothetical protein
MQTITETTSATLMAQWLATGGATDAPGRETAAGDDGLEATGPTKSVTKCFIDDGLAATQPTIGYRCATDDGLAATQLSQPYPAGYCAEDDGLAANGSPSFQIPCR